MRNIVQRPAGERREAGAEDRARRRPGRRPRRCPRASAAWASASSGSMSRSARPGGRGSRRALRRLAAAPIVEAAFGLAPQCARGDQLGQLFRRLSATAEHLADREADIESDGVRKLDRSDRHAEGERRLIDGFRRDAFVDAAHRLHQVRRENAIDQESGRTLHRQRQLVDLARKCRGQRDQFRARASRRRRSRPASSWQPD